MLPRQKYCTPFPPQDLHGSEHQMAFDNPEKEEVLEWCRRHAGERGKDFWYPVEGIIIFRDPRLRTLFKLTWYGKRND